MNDIISIFNNQLNIDNVPIHELIDILDSNDDNNQLNIDNVPIDELIDILDSNDDKNKHHISINTTLYLLKEHMLSKAMFINDLLQCSISQNHRIFLSSYITDLYTYINIISYIISVYQL